MNLRESDYSEERKKLKIICNITGLVGLVTLVGSFLFAKLALVLAISSMIMFVFYLHYSKKELELESRKSVH